MSAPDSIITLKVCTKCGVAYPNTSDHFHKRGPGLRTDCKECGSARAKTRYRANIDVERTAARERYYARREERIAVVTAWREANPEKAREYSAKWNKAHPEAIRAASARYRERHPEKVAATLATYRANNPEKVKETQAKWAAAHPEKMLDKWRRHGARRAAAPGNHTAADKRRQRDIQSDRCWYCMSPLNGGGQTDHRHPLSRGGSDYAENIVWTCAPCNQAKGAMTEAEYLAQLEATV